YSSALRPPPPRAARSGAGPGGPESHLSVRGRRLARLDRQRSASGRGGRPLLGPLAAAAPGHRPALPPVGALLAAAAAPGALPRHAARLLLARRAPHPPARGLRHGPGAARQLFARRLLAPGHGGRARLLPAVPRRRQL